jgi:hypothetical protein
LEASSFQKIVVALLIPALFVVHFLTFDHVPDWVHWANAGMLVALAVVAWLKSEFKVKAPNDV